MEKFSGVMRLPLCVMMRRTHLGAQKQLLGESWSQETGPSWERQDLNHKHPVRRDGLKTALITSTNDVINHAFIKKPLENPIEQGWEVLLMPQHRQRLDRAWQLYAFLFSPYAVQLFTHCSSAVSTTSFTIKVTITKVFHWVLWIFLATHWVVINPSLWLSGTGDNHHRASNTDTVLRNWTLNLWIRCCLQVISVRTESEDT